MKILEKFVLILYSFFMLIVSVLACLIIFKVITVDKVKYCIDFIQNDVALLITVLSVSIICMLLSVRCLFFRKKKQIKKSTATGILLENESGRLLISKRAIENATKNIVEDSLNSSIDTNVTVDIDPANNISVYISVVLDRAINVRDLTLDMQLKIKNEIKDSFGVEVKQVNIKVDSDEKKIENKKEQAKIEVAKNMIDKKEDNVIEINESKD